MHTFLYIACQLATCACNFAFADSQPNVNNHCVMCSVVRSCQCNRRNAPWFHPCLQTTAAILTYCTLRMHQCSDAAELASCLDAGPVLQYVAPASLLLQPETLVLGGSLSANGRDQDQLVAESGPYAVWDNPELDFYEWLNSLAKDPAQVRCQHCTWWCTLYHFLCIGTVHCWTAKASTVVATFVT